MSNRNITITFPTLSVLLILFLVLKLTETITWSWWWVCSPIWMPIALFIGVTGIALLFLFIAMIIDILWTKRRF